MAGGQVGRDRFLVVSLHDSLLNHRNQRGADGCKNGHKKLNMAGSEGTESQGLERVKGNDNSERHIPWQDMWETDTERFCDLLPAAACLQSES